MNIQIKNLFGNFILVVFVGLLLINQEQCYGLPNRNEYNITLDYNRFSIPLTPGINLDSISNNILRENSKKLVWKDLELVLTDDGVLELSKISNSQLLWQSEVPEGEFQGPFRLVLEPNCSLVIYSGDNATVWTSGAGVNDTSQDGPFYFTVLEEGAYGYRWGMWTVYYKWKRCVDAGSSWFAASKRPTSG
ncbi:hypothetical protein PPL_03184 [Heterostelium album PN500]|uniref:Bulb-type lectin domain-containing protein n=1 Tax=Heterostelium pallidum (strain ATCC 26659 / Pp 5 / PN500) TaxID=670386 RepID=D3B463_HETP5|nr:hypothetical protein PPL_03184 [Heterostelium album PN500]EFA84111.1 hypothetical protein PPL_03184 [Heterostelium album PN500]|eukprot:XP_020436228.1 hypothetical protein PPL_03184 [Heterostelium album PN500]